ncbi:peptide-methionine (S)-S-oxide reductase MsrA [Patescibacteria group bacterium]|nr:peptide-methionine (S)-S-oxide reductase MsrA [Patescibacteria group bacterium]
MKTIVLGGGCFWCLEPIFRRVSGVSDVVVGYAGGDTDNPSYREVCSGTTGHAEVVHITYDPNVVPLEKLLEIFFTVHDPTTLNRQGADVGTQYRSIILSGDDQDLAIARQIIDGLNNSGAYTDPIVTEVVPLEIFYPAEDYHQGYFAKNPQQAYCQIVIAPKLEKFKKVFEGK